MLNSVSQKPRVRPLKGRLMNDDERCRAETWLKRGREFNVKLCHSLAECDLGNFLRALGLNSLSTQRGDNIVPRSTRIQG